MTKIDQTGILFSCRAIILTVVYLLLMVPSSYADAFDKLRTNLPLKLAGWTAEAKDRIFDEKTIFDYINGAGEVYKAYHMQRCLSRRYAHPKEPAIVLDIFDMGSSKDAFGVFTHDTDGKVVDIGQDGRFRPGWLSFWQNRFFVSIYMEEESGAAEKAVKDLGRRIAENIKTEGSKPKILRRLPQEGLQSKDIRYLHHPIVLNYHYYLAEKNILNITSKTDVVLATYTRGPAQARLLLIVYPDPTAASKAIAGFLKYYLPDADSTGTALLEDGKWTAAAFKERILAVVLEAESRKLAENLLREVLSE